MSNQPTPLQFIQLLYKGAVAKGVIEFRLLPSRKQLWMAWPMFEGHPDEIKKFPRTQDVYFGVSLRRDSSDGGRKNVEPSHLQWIDLDLKGTRWTHGQSDVLKMTPDELRECARAAFDFLMNAWRVAGLSPRAVVYTGHGLQVYWARRVRAADLDEVEMYNKGLAAAFEGDPKTFDAPRIFRLPGTQNLKNKQRPLPVELWHADPEAWIETAQLEPYRMLEKARPAQVAAPTEPSAGGQQEREGVIVQFNHRWPVTAILERYGYRREDDHTYTRPGEDASGRDVKLLENKRGVLCSYHHSSNDPLAASPDSEHLMEPFDLYRLNEHGGDFKAAVRAAAAELGLGHEGAGGTIGGGKAKTAVKVDKTDPFSPPPSSGVYVKHGCYYIDRPVKKNGEVVEWVPDQLTNWIFEPELKLLYPDGSTAQRGSLQVLGHPHQVQISSKAWNGRKDILEVVGAYEARAFTSSNGDIAKIGDYISTNFPDLPIAIGVKSYGLHQVDDEWVEVYEDQTISNKPRATALLFRDAS